MLCVTGPPTVSQHTRKARVYCQGRKHSTRLAKPNTGMMPAPFGALACSSTRGSLGMQESGPAGVLNEDTGTSQAWPDDCKFKAIHRQANFWIPKWVQWDQSRGLVTFWRNSYAISLSHYKWGLNSSHNKPITQYHGRSRTKSRAQARASRWYISHCLFMKLWDIHGLEFKDIKCRGIGHTIWNRRHSDSA